MIYVTSYINHGTHTDCSVKNGIVSEHQMHYAELMKQTGSHTEFDVANHSNMCWLALLYKIQSKILFSKWRWFNLGWDAQAI